MVLILDGRSEHFAQMWTKQGFQSFWVVQGDFQGALQTFTPYSELLSDISPRQRSAYK